MIEKIFVPNIFPVTDSQEELYLEISKSGVEKRGYQFTGTTFPNLSDFLTVGTLGTGTMT